MGETSSRELAADGQPCRLKDLNEQLHTIMMDLLQEKATMEEVEQRREEHMREQEKIQQQQQYHATAISQAQQGGTADQRLDQSPQQQQQQHQQQQQQQTEEDGEIADPFAPAKIPTLGVAIELRTKQAAAGSAELVESVHRVWIALTLPGVGLGDAGAKEAAADALSKSENLELIDLAYNDITATGIAALCPAIAASPAAKECLVFLRFSGNAIGAAGARAVAQSLEAMPLLEELQLYNCGITDEGVHALVNGLRLHDSIRVINLGKNPTTRKAILMLTELAKRCKTLLHIRVEANAPHENVNSNSIDPNASNNNNDCGDVNASTVKDDDYANLDAALEANRAEQRERDARRAVLAQKRVRREAAARDDARRRAEEAREEREALAGRIREIEAAQRQQDADVQRLEALAAEKEALTRAKRAHQRAAESTEALDRAMRQAAEWRDKLGVSTGKAAVFRDGFSMYTRQVVVDRDGTVREEMVPYDRNPKRLKACWCDPPEAAVPYARKLHYHCKYENASVDLLGATAAKDLTDTSKYTTTDLPQYQGCRSTGHVCSSVGYYTKPLPNKTAAHFFSSQHPSYDDEEEQQMQFQQQQW